MAVVDMGRSHILIKAGGVAVATSVAALDPAVPLWARVAGSAAGIVVIGWLWRTFVRQAIDNASLDGARRNRAGWNAFLRAEIFQTELQGWARHDEELMTAMQLATGAHAIATANAEVLGTIASGVQIIRAEQDDFRREMRRAIRDAVRHGTYQNRKDDGDEPVGDPG